MPFKPVGRIFPCLFLPSDGDLGVVGFAEFLWGLIHCFIREKRKLETVTGAFISPYTLSLSLKGREVQFRALYLLDHIP